MALTDKQINDLNNMNVAAQNIQLGTTIDSLNTSNTAVTGATVTLDSTGKITGLTITLGNGTEIEASIQEE